jgi:hypothetical protein
MTRRLATTLQALIVLASWFYAINIPHHASAQQALRARQIHPKPSLEQLRTIPASNAVLVKFRDGSGLRYIEGRLEGPETEDSKAFEAVLGRFNLSPNDLERVFPRPDADLNREREQGQQKSGEQLADLTLFYAIILPKPADAAEIAYALNELDVVEHAEPARPLAPLPIDIFPPTPNFTANQTYKNDAPLGIGVPTTTQVPGSDGNLWKYADIEYRWQLDHEDLDLGAADRFVPSTHMVSDRYLLPITDPKHSPPTQCQPFEPPQALVGTGSSEHGTAVLGVISAQLNAYGMIGIAPGANAFVVPTYCQEAKQQYSVARAINHAAGEVRHILIEQQFGGTCGGPGRALGPVEQQMAEFLAIKDATARGVVVVEAAGNGLQPSPTDPPGTMAVGIDLDSNSCNRELFRRDSGAIMVGAGASIGHSRLAFSNFGNRVDVQGWGNNVATLGYGASGLGGIPATFSLFDQGVQQRYTSAFGGTSSASAIVMGAVLSIQGALRDCGVTLSSVEMRDLLVATGTPQGGAVAGKIGPLPNIKAALASHEAIRRFRPVLTYFPVDFPFSVEADFYAAGGGYLKIRSSTGKVNFQINGVPPWLKAIPSSGSADPAGTDVLLVPTNPGLLFEPGYLGSFLNVVNLTSGLVDNRFSISATLEIRPANDRFAKAAPLPLDQTVRGSNVNARKEAGEPNHANVAGGRSVWWRFTPPTNVGIIMHTCGSSFDTVLAVYTGSDVNALTTVAQNDNSNLCSGGQQSALSFSAMAGMDYYVAVDGSAGQTGTIELTTTYGGALHAGSN